MGKQNVILQYSGKTVLANFLRHNRECWRTIQDYNRSKDPGLSCSGDLEFESCWPTVIKDCNGVVIVLSPDFSRATSRKSKHGMFISTQGLQGSQCLLIEEPEDNRLYREMCIM
uniref:Uncharacterized protein n=1 Tax=Neogobius melanostomus TaxID=47308 RepID=A0A8C6TZZ4_9GOBI